MNRRPSTQDLTWLLDLDKSNQLNLDPPYQRKSVWTLKDKQYFLDSIFRNYPSPAIFLHKTIDENGRSTYHVVDGKQRIQTILSFVRGDIRISPSYGDARLDGKKWSDLVGETDLKQAFWNYQITVEQIDFVEGAVVNEVFDRLNRNSRRLTDQELRHAKFEGWLIGKVEAEAEKEEWQRLGIATKARARRMLDVQFISELFFVVLERSISGFDQRYLDDLYAKYENPMDSAPEMDEDRVLGEIEAIKRFLLQMEEMNGCITSYARSFGNFYPLWSLIAIEGVDKVGSVEVFCERYAAFMAKVSEVAVQDDVGKFLQDHSDEDYAHAHKYFDNSRGASTDLNQRASRLDALRFGVIR
ncbi:MAG: DUF262 domain-containing protein [Alcanivoracaceae bacterium]|nr:DUF262 domain-containing protein [Alcanivoracaceae bacterium]